MLCCVICYTFPDVSKNSNTYTSGLLISFFLDYIFSEDRGIAPPRNVGNSLPVDTLQKKSQTTECFTFHSYVFLTL